MRLTPSLASFVDVLERRAGEQPDDTAYVFLESGEQESARITWSVLERRSRALGTAIAGLVEPGSRVLVMFPPGIEFASGFFGALYGGAIAVPTYPPSGGRIDRAVARLRGLVADAGISLVVSTASVESHRLQLEAVLPELAGIPWLVTERVDGAAADAWVHPDVGRDAVAFLQYTSGSTAAPRGVMVTHGNLIENLAASSTLARHDCSSVLVSWLPVNHDMGLIQGVLQPAYSGFPAWLMAPAAFLQRPARWLQAISRLSATHSGGPNFAYDLCVRRIPEAERDTFDLSGWRVAFNGSEPVRRDTLESFHRRFGICGFRWNAFRPAYGLAESTLVVTSRPCGDDPTTIDVDRRRLAAGLVTPRRLEPGTHEGDVVSLVSSGSAAPGSEVAIVDPQRRVRSGADRVGEIWIAGPSVASGYWRRPQDTADTFLAYLADGKGPYLRTGDLGVLRDGELFVTGRLKDVIVIRGLKHYPQDIERTVEQAVREVRPGCCAAFAFDRLGEERAAIVAEVDSASGTSLERLEEAVDAIRRQVIEAHCIAPAAVVFVAAGSLAKTTSGKLQRYACRDAFLAGTLDVVSHWIDGGPIGALEQAAS
jgi:acyl-CoA synthetase (AMP-forming)/AMP-acid ligase II